MTTADRSGRLLAGDLHTNAPQVASAAPKVLPRAITVYDAPDGHVLETDIATPKPVFVNAPIGSDPNALACAGSPWRGGLTNAEAQRALQQRGAP